MRNEGKARTASTAAATVLSLHRSAVILSFALGVITVLGFAPFYLFPIPVITLAGLFHLWGKANGPWRTAWLGFAFGLGFFGAGVSWIFIALYRYGGMPLPLAAIATALFCAYLALFPGLAGFLQAKFPFRGVTRWVLLIPALWTLLEWVRGWLFTGFPWLSVGYSQAPSSPLAGFAPALGVYGVSLATVLSAGLLATIFQDGKSKAEARGESSRGLSSLILVALWLSGISLTQIQWTEPAGERVTVSLLQGNIPQDMKFREDRLPGTLRTYRELTQRASARLIILPETALPLFKHEVPADYVESLAGHARNNNGDVLVGLFDYSRANGGEYYNSVVSFGTAPTQIYRKQHLVPFGEFIPLRPLLGWFITGVLHIPLSDQSAGAPFQPPLLVAGQRVAVDICYEDVFGEEVIRQLPQATLLVNVTNDAWYGNSIASRQHNQMSQMRALEAGRYMLRATNTGVSAIIDQRGKVLAQAETFTTAALTGEAQGFTGATPYVRYGNGVTLAIAALMMVAGVVLRYRGVRPAASV